MFSTQPVNVLDCTHLVPQPIDVAPIRSPQEVHTVIANKLRGRQVVEIGTRNGDGMSCFARAATKASAVEVNQKYCDLLEERKRIEKLAFDIQCSDYTLAQLDADFITWWQQAPMTNQGVLENLRCLQQQGGIRIRAQAVLVFDTQWRTDMASFQSLKKLIKWKQEVNYDEFTQCEKFKLMQSIKSVESGFTCERSVGRFIVAGINIADMEIGKHCAKPVQSQADGRIYWHGMGLFSSRKAKNDNEGILLFMGTILLCTLMILVLLRRIIRNKRYPRLRIM